MLQKISKTGKYGLLKKVRSSWKVNKMISRSWKYPQTTNAELENSLKSHEDIICDIDNWGQLLICLKVFVFSPEIDKFLNENVMRDLSLLLKKIINFSTSVL